MAISGWRKRILVAWLIVPVLSGSLLTACDQPVTMGLTSIGEITRGAASFEGSEVKLKGRTSQLLKIPLIDAKGYLLSDSTGEILVMTAGPMPTDSEEVVVHGRIENVGIIAGQSFGLTLQEIGRQPAGFRWPWK